jgi:predicted Zn-dependent peptidase
MKTRKSRNVRLHMVGPYAVLLQHIPSPIVHVECAINSGFLHETKETTGINHLLEHVLTEGWSKCGTTCSELWSKRGVEMNASTDETLVHYYTSGTPANLVEMVQYITDISDHPLMTRKVMEKEKEAVIDELDTYGSDPESKIDIVFNHAAYTGGLAFKDDWKLQITNLKHISLADIQKAYRENYNPRNMMYIVYGTFDDAEVLSIFRKELTKKDAGTVVPPQCFSYAHKILYSHEDSPTTKVVIGFPSAVMRGDEASIYAGVICSILNNLLFTLLRTKLTLVYGVRFTRQTDSCGTLIMCSIYARDKNVAPCLKALFGELKKLEAGFPKEVMAAVKQSEMYSHYNHLPYTQDYLLQYMHQIGSKHPRIVSREDKIRLIKKMTAGILEPHYRKLVNMDCALCVYQGSNDLGLKWADLV